MSKEKAQRSSDNAPFTNKVKQIILVVEDDRTHRVFMEKILKKNGFSVVTAESGVTALSQIDTGQHFDLIVMDWDMPELDGLETVRVIRAREIKEGRPHIPVIAFTANRQPGDREKCLASGMDAYLSKDAWLPKWQHTLVDNLQNLIAGNVDMQNFEIKKDPVQKGAGEEFDLDAFDIKALERYASLLKDELFTAVDEFLEDAAAYIRDIEEGIKNNDMKKSVEGSHPLKSNSQGFGMVAVAQIAHAINVDAREGNIEAVKSLFPQLQEAFRRAESKLRQEVKRFQ